MCSNGFTIKIDLFKYERFKDEGWATHKSILKTDFQQIQLYHFQNLILGFILKIFSKFCTFQPRYSYKYILIGKKCNGKTFANFQALGYCPCRNEVLIKLLNGLRRLTLHSLTILLLMLRNH